MTSRTGLVDPGRKSRELSRDDNSSFEAFGGPVEVTRADSRPTGAVPPLVTEGEWIDASDSRVGTAKLITIGFLVIALFFGAGLLWAGLAPLSSAAIAPGVVSVAGNRKTVQHLEGGIVKAIRVREGDAVTTSQVLIQLDDTQARTTLDLLKAQHMAALLEEARLNAELTDQATLKVSFDGQQPEGETARQILQDQLDIFRTRRNTLQNQSDLLKNRIVQHDFEISGIEGQIIADRKQLDLVEQEIEAIQTLVEKGLSTRSKLYSLLREEAGLEASIVQRKTQIASIRGGIQDVKTQISELHATRFEQAATEIRQVRDKLVELKEKLPPAEDAYRRTEIRAPIGGRVVNLQAHTVGGVISSGTPILDIVPGNDQLVIEARLDPKDRDVVTSGMPAEVRFTAFNQRHSLPVKGRVVWISADGLSDEKTGSPYYVARIELTEDPANALSGASIYPGMQANVMIITGQKTALSYLFRPLTRTFTGAFREE
ncbi:MAG: HlyD family type I secretion periplasmic adaptor subunit [Geminicoccaceae bacterium]